MIPDTLPPATMNGAMLYGGLALTFGLAFLLLYAFWSRSLKKTVASKTAELKDALAKLESTQATLSAIVNSTEDFIFSVDARDFSLLSFNRALAEAARRNFGVLLHAGMTSGEVFPTAEHAALWTGLFNRALAEGNLVAELPTYRGGRALEVSVNLLEADGRVFGISVFAKDVTAQRSAAEERQRNLEAERQRLADLETILDSVPAAVWIAHDPECSVITGNRAAAELLHLSTEVNMSMSVGETGAPRRHRAFKEGRELAPEEMPVQVAARGERILDFEFDFVLEDGEVRHMLGNALPLIGKEGKSKGSVAAFVDITKRKEMEKEREKLQEQLLQSQKMESIGKLAGGVAHDFNNMLGVILGHTELAAAQIDTSNPVYGDLEEIGKAARRSAEITRQLLAFARKQTIAPRHLDLNESVSDLLKMIRRLIGEDIVLTWTPGPNLWKVRMDPAQIGQIVANLATNARDAISGTGRISIETANETVGEEWRRRDPECSPGEYVALTVTDDGCGIGEEEIKRIFDPFFTTKEVGRGTGLGLATVYGIVRQNNGLVGVESEPGRGTTFKVLLPRAHGEVEAREAAAEIDLRGVEAVMVVEDELSNLKLIDHYLTSLGYRVTATTDPGEALELAGRAGGVDLLVTDVVMPGTNGRELEEAFRGAYPEVRTIYMSGYPADVIAQRGVLDDGVNFIQKPFQLREFARKVREALDLAGPKDPF